MTSEMREKKVSFFRMRIRSLQIVFLFHLLDLLFLLLHVQLLERFRRLVVENDEVAIADVEARKVVTGLLRVEYVLVNNECRT